MAGAVPRQDVSDKVVAALWAPADLPVSPPADELYDAIITQDLKLLTDLVSDMQVIGVQGGQFVFRCLVELLKVECGSLKTTHLRQDIGSPAAQLVFLVPKEGEPGPLCPHALWALNLCLVHQADACVKR